MIINHKYKFCYFAIPRTGSKALSQVLIEKLDSEVYLRMHASYEEFVNKSPEDYQRYLKLTTIRNPLDSIVSSYFKKKTDHNGRFSRGTYKLGKPLSKRALEEFHFIKNNNASFSEFLCHFYSNAIYQKNRITDTANACDVIFKFESLQTDFNHFLDRLGLQPIEIPVVNKTKEKSNDFLKYYDAKAQNVALKAFAPIMENWNYDFPKDWI